MLGLQRHDLITHLPILRVGAGEMCGALDREIVRFGRARGEDDLARIGLDQRGDFAAGALDRLGGDPAIRVAGAVRVAEMLGEVRQHRLEDARVYRRRRLVVEIDRRRVDRRLGGKPRARIGKKRRHAARAPSARPRQRR